MRILWRLTAIAIVAVAAAWLFFSVESQVFGPAEPSEPIAATLPGDAVASPSDASDVIATGNGSSVAPGTAEVASSVNTESTPPEHFGRRFDALLAQSATGDNSAKLALAAGMEHCSRRRDSRASYLAIQYKVDELTGKYAKEGRTEPSIGFQSLVKSLEQVKQEADLIAADCIGISDEELKDRWKFQLEAANTGDERAVMDFLEHPAIDATEAFADDTAIKAFKAHAQRLLESQLAANSVRAHKAYVRAGYDVLMKPQHRFHDALSRVITPDPVRILAFDTALARAGVPGFGSGPDFNAMHQRILDPMQIMEAEALAQRLWPTLVPKRS